MHRDSIVLGGVRAESATTLLAASRSAWGTLSPSPISTTWGAAGSLLVSTVDAWFCPEARPQMTDQR